LDKELQIPGELPSKICPRIGGKIIAHQTAPPELKHMWINGCDIKRIMIEQKEIKTNTETIQTEQKKIRFHLDDVEKAIEECEGRILAKLQEKEPEKK
jgi:hypothetical protein